MLEDLVQKINELNKEETTNNDTKRTLQLQRCEYVYQAQKEIFEECGFNNNCKLYNDSISKFRKDIKYSKAQLSKDIVVGEILYKDKSNELRNKSKSAIYKEYMKETVNQVNRLKNSKVNKEAVNQVDSTLDPEKEKLRNVLKALRKKAGKYWDGCLTNAGIDLSINDLLD